MAKKRRRGTLKGIPEQHLSAGKRMAQEADDLAQRASKEAHAGNCAAAIVDLRRMARAEGMATVHYEGAHQTLPVKTVALTKATTDTVYRTCSLKCK